VYLLGVGLALVAGALVGTERVLGLRPGITKANVRRIQPGMTYAQVKRLLGRRGCHTGASCTTHGVRWYYAWAGSDVDVEVAFSDEGIVLSTFIEPHPTPVSPLARLRAWLGW
jgi:hypothetical protein